MTAIDKPLKANIILEHDAWKITKENIAQLADEFGTRVTSDSTGTITGLVFEGDSHEIYKVGDYVVQTRVSGKLMGVNGPLNQIIKAWKFEPREAIDSHLNDTPKKTPALNKPDKVEVTKDE